MTTKIVSNGSRFAGEAPASLEDLFDLLGREPLDLDWLSSLPQEAPLLRKGGVQLVYPDAPGTVCFLGNFANLSHVFQIDTDDAALIVRLRAAIAANVARWPDTVASEL